MKAIPILVILVLSAPVCADAAKDTVAGAPDHRTFEPAKWFYNRAQRGARALEEKQYERAASLFQQPYRKGIARYRAGDYPEAEQAFRSATGQNTGPAAHYNLGNTLYQQGRYREAIEAYDQVLAVQPQHEDALFNKRLAEQKLQQQQDNGQDSSAADRNPQQEEKNPIAEPMQPPSGSSSPGEQPNQQQHQASPESGKDEPNDESDRENAAIQPTPEESAGSAADRALPKPASAHHDSGTDAEELAARQWLNRLEDNPRQLLKNQFYLREQRSHQREGNNPW